MRGRIWALGALVLLAAVGARLGGQMPTSHPAVEARTALPSWIAG